MVGFLPMIHRKQHVDTLLRRLRAFPVVAILGPRQIGKTTLARQVGRESCPLGAKVRGVAAKRLGTDLGL